MVITGDYFFLGLVLIALFFTWFSGVRKSILNALVAFLIWFSLGMWLFFPGGAPPIDGLSNMWVQLLAWSFFVLSFVPWLLQMDTEIRHEDKGLSWRSWEEVPKSNKESGYETYKKEFLRRVRR